MPVHAADDTGQAGAEAPSLRRNSGFPFSQPSPPRTTRLQHDSFPSPEGLQPPLCYHPGTPNATAYSPHLVEELNLQQALAAGVELKYLDRRIQQLAPGDPHLRKPGVKG